MVVVVMMITLFSLHTYNLFYLLGLALCYYELLLLLLLRFFFYYYYLTIMMMIIKKINKYYTTEEEYCVIILFFFILEDDRSRPRQTVLVSHAIIALFVASFLILRRSRFISLRLECTLDIWSL